MHWLERTALTGFWVVAAIALFGIATTGGGRGTASAADRSHVREIRDTDVLAATSGVAQLATVRCSEALALLRASESPLAALACFAQPERAGATETPVDARLPGAPLGESIGESLGDSLAEPAVEPSAEPRGESLGEPLRDPRNDPDA